MGELEDKINNILNDPGEMEKLSKLAGQIMGGQAGGLGALSGLGGLGGNKGDAPFSMDDIDPQMLSSLGRIISKANGGEGDKRVLLEALRPFLAEKRREKMERAIKLARLAKIAELAFSEFGGKDDV